MENPLFYCAGTTPACHFAAGRLMNHHIPFIEHISPEITHLLLDVPSFRSDTQAQCIDDLKRLLHMLPVSLTIIGGNLSNPIFDKYRTIDLLKDPWFLAQNAYITAECALQTAAPLMTTTFQGTPVLVAGWGRIGKCLCHLLQNLGCRVTVSARKETDRAMACALGLDAIALDAPLQDYRLIFNTVPELILPENRLAECKNCIKIDLASRRGIGGEDVLWARGLPGIHAPESSGLLIAQSILRFMREDTT